MKWTSDDIPDMRGKTVLITGANSGLGYESARALAKKGAHVLMACRNPDKARGAADAIRAEHAEASLELLPLDLASLASVRSLAGELSQRLPALHVLLNNAGIMAIPYAKTADGFEMQFGTNHLGHFALTALLFDKLAATSGARVVSVSSGAHVMGSMRFDDLAWERGYSKWRAYGMSKLANLLFTYELARRITEKHLGVLSAAAHPGYAATNLQYAGADLRGSKLLGKMLRFGNPMMGQSPAMGALPQLYAATAPDVAQGDYIGPDSLLGSRGHPTKAKSNARSHDPEAMKRLWDVSEELTGTRFSALSGL